MLARQYAWSGGTYGVGRRIPIAPTRALLRAALEGKLAAAPVRKYPNFGMSVPEACPEVPSEVLDPRGTWSDKKAYDEIARGPGGLRPMSPSSSPSSAAKAMKPRLALQPD